jgi:transposase
MESTPVPDLSEIAVYLGLDVGNGEHHAVALTPNGKTLHDRALPNSEPRLRALFAKLARHGKVLVVVNQPASIDALPHTLRDLQPDDETIAALYMLLGHDDDLAAEATRTSNRIRGLLTAIHPHLERVLGTRIARPAVLELLTELRSPAGIRAAGKDAVAQLLGRRAPRMATRLAEEIFAALDEQTVVVPGTDAAAVILPSLAASLAAVLEQRRRLEAEIETLLEAHPLAKVLTSMPGIGVRTGARILAEIGDASAFPSAAHLAAYAGLALVTRRSGSSIRGETPARRGNRLLKRAFFLAEFASLSHPPSRASSGRPAAHACSMRSGPTCCNGWPKGRPTRPACTKS